MNTDRLRRLAPGLALAALPLHPRLGHMLVRAGKGAARMAALLAERDPLKGAPADLALRVQAVDDIRTYEDRHPWPAHRGTLERVLAADGSPAGWQVCLTLLHPWGEIS